jgi:hypothetical protein
MSKQEFNQTDFGKRVEDFLKARNFLCTICLELKKSSQAFCDKCEEKIPRGEEFDIPPNLKELADALPQPPDDEYPMDD